MVIHFKYQRVLQVASFSLIHHSLTLIHWLKMQFRLVIPGLGVDFPVVLMLTLGLVTMGTACLTSPMKACTTLIKAPRVIENELPSILSIQVADRLVDSSKGTQTSVFGVSGHTVARVVGIYSTSHRMKNLGCDDPLYRPGPVTRMLEKIKFLLGLFEYFSLMENISGTGYIIWCTHWCIASNSYSF